MALGFTRPSEYQKIFLARQPHAVRWFLARLIFGPEDGGDTFLRNFRLHGAISQKMATFITTTVGTSNPTEQKQFVNSA
jgi:hypothetical protein